MAIEKERRFLVPASCQFPTDPHYAYIRQGYLTLDPERTVRVRQVCEMFEHNYLNSSNDVQSAFITVKGPKDKSGAGHEFEYPIPYGDAEEMIKMCGDAVVEKARYKVKMGPHTIEMDVFYGANTGLIIAEVEHDSESFEPPARWTEVTANPKQWSNAALAQHPYSKSMLTSGGTPLLDGSRV